MTSNQGSIFTSPHPILLLLFFVPWSQIQTLDLLFVSVGFIHCQIRNGIKKQVMHSLGLAPTLGSAGRGGRERRAGCSMESVQNHVGHSDLASHPQMENGGSEMPPWVTQHHGLAGVNCI